MERDAPFMDSRINSLFFMEIRRPNIIMTRVANTMKPRPPTWISASSTACPNREQVVPVFLHPALLALAGDDLRREGPVRTLFLEQVRDNVASLCPAKQTVGKHFKPQKTVSFAGRSRITASPGKTGCVRSFGAPAIHGESVRYLPGLGRRWFRVRSGGWPPNRVLRIKAFTLSDSGT